MLNLDKEQLRYLYFSLRHLRSYRYMDIPHGVVLWKPYHQDLYEQVIHERSKLDSSFKEESEKKIKT